MKKLLTLGLLFASASAFAAESIKTLDVDIWNKTDKPLYFELGTAQRPPMGKNLVELQASVTKGQSLQDRIIKGIKDVASSAFDLRVKGDFAQTKINNAGQQTLILFSRTKNLQPGSKAVLVTVFQGKDILLRLKDDASGIQLFEGDAQRYILGPQSGPLGGLTGRSERGLSLANMAKSAELRINPNYIIPASKPANDFKPSLEKSEKEKALEKAMNGEHTLTPEQQKAVDTLKELGMDDQD